MEECSGSFVSFVAAVLLNAASLSLSAFSTRSKFGFVGGYCEFEEDENDEP